MPELADFVFHRAQRSVYLIEGLRHALADLKRPDLLAMLELVMQDAAQAQDASRAAMEHSKRERALVMLSDLRDLVAPLAPEKEQLALRVAKHLVAS